MDAKSTLSIPIDDMRASNPLQRKKETAGWSNAWLTEKLGYGSDDALHKLLRYEIRPGKLRAAVIAKLLQKTPEWVEQHWEENWQKRRAS